MNFYILTLFPEMVEGGLATSITGRAMEKGLIAAKAINIRDYSKEKHRHVDDVPYGGGAGMVMQPAPVCDAYEDLCSRLDGSWNEELRRYLFADFLRSDWVIRRTCSKSRVSISMRKKQP